MTQASLGTALASAALLVLPLLVSGSLHMWIVTRGVLAGLAQPIHRTAFGANKTWRGFLVMPLATVPGVLLARAIAPAVSTETAASLAAVDPLLLGLLLGLGYVLAELPNSYMKRRLGIAPGRPAARHRFWFSFLDQADSAIGCALVYAALTDVPGLSLALLVVLGPVIHLAANLALYGLGLRKEAL